MTPFERRPRDREEQALLDRTAALLPASARMPTVFPDSALVVREGRGARLVDWSGNEYVDYLLGSGAMFVGHAQPTVVDAVRAALERGTSFLLPNEPAVRLAEEIVRSTPCADRILYGSTGTDAVLFAIRLARAFRGRDTILKFEGAYHGQSDPVLMSNQWTRDPAPFPQPVANSVGLPAHTAADVLIAPWNDIETTAALVDAHADSLACVIAEPMQRTFPPRGRFLHDLRELTARHEIPLVFDEVVTGYRLGYASAQGRYGVTPDLCAMGKSLSAGHPISVVAGRADLMAYAEGARRLTGDYVSVTGTFSGNPISCTAALAALELLRGEGVYERVETLGRRLMDAIRKAFEEVDVAVRVTGEPSAFEAWFTDEDVVDFRSAARADARLGHRFAQALLERGVMKAHEKFFVSIAHDDADVDLTVDAIRDVAHEIARSR